MHNNFVRLTPYSIKYALNSGVNGELEEFFRCFDSANEMFRWTSKMYAFNDCYEFIVRSIIADGHSCEYAGWQPGMLFEYYDVVTGETIFEETFPELEH